MKKRTLDPRSLFLAPAILFLMATAHGMSNGASVSGQVVDSAGKPQMGVTVEVFTSASARPSRVYTDEKGRYLVGDLAPGTYFIKASADTFLPTLRENVRLRAGASLLVNLTLNTLAEAFQILPARVRGEKDDDDWRWTLRSSANRPILRVLDDDSPLIVVASSENEDDRALKARVAFVAGNDGEGIGRSDMKTTFNVEQSLFRSGTMSFVGDVATGASSPNTVLRASYRQQTAGGTNPEIAFTMRRLASVGSVRHRAALNALAVTLTDSFTAGGFLEFSYGGEMQSIQYRDRISAFRPFGSVAAHLGPDTVLAYSYATSRPNTRLSKGFDSSPADLSETNPRVSLMGGRPQLEKALHQEVALNRRMGKTSFQVALFQDRVNRTALSGIGNVEATAGPLADDFLTDAYEGTFAYTGSNFSTQGVRVVAQRKLNDSLTATMNYSVGGALAPSGDRIMGSASPADFAVVRRHSVSAKLAGNVRRTGTRWIASYKWTSGGDTVTPVDMFNASAGQADPFLNLFIRQPIPGTNFLSGRMEALIDVRNLLAQGYVPMYGKDGQTLYLVQTSRAVRTGVAFNF